MWKNKEKTVNKMLKTWINLKSNFNSLKCSILNPQVNKKQDQKDGLLRAYYELYTYSHP